MEPSLPAEAASVPNPIGTKSSEAKPPKLALIPLRSAPIKINRQQKPLEAKQFPIVLGRTNLSQWWYESCDCQQYYCRLHCRPVAKNIGSLSKVMIQIDTQGKAHIVGKNPHLVTITSPERNDTKKTTTEAATETKEDQQTPVMLRKGDILIIGRRDREPWMRFQVVENGAVASPHFKRKSANATISNERLVKSETSSLQPPILAPQQQESKPQQEQAPKNNARHDARLPEWITTTITNNSSSNNNNNNNDSKNTRNYHYAENTNNNNTTTDTKEQQRHQAMVATLTRAAAAAGAAADAEHNKNSKSNNNNKPYRYNSYYNYYNGSGSNYEPTADPIQRKRRRTTLYPQMTTSNVSTNTNNNNNSKSVIRSAEDLFHNGSSRRAGGRLHHNNDPQIHLVFQDYETSAQLIRAGTKKARNPQRKRKRVRTDRDFIGKATDELQQQQQQQQQQPQTMGLMLSQNYAAALLNVGTPALAKSIPEDT